MSVSTQELLIEAVRNMREAQKNYFHTRAQSHLREAKAYEREVDSYLAALANAEQKRRNPELSLGV